MKREFDHFIFGIIGIVLFISCSPNLDPINLAPTVHTVGATDLYRKGAVLHGCIKDANQYNMQEFGIEYTNFIDINYALSSHVMASTMDEDGNFSVQLDSLDAGTYYRYRAYAFSGYSYSYGGDSIFQLPPMTAPVFGEIRVDNVSFTSFDITISLVDNGGTKIDNSGFIYVELNDADQQKEAQDISLSHATPNVVIIPSIEYFTMEKSHTATIENLNPGKYYAIRPYASSYGNEYGMGYGNVVKVKTQESVQMLLSSCEQLETTPNSLLLKASVLSYGDYPIKQVGFLYSTENTDPDSTTLLKKEAILDGEINEFQATIDGMSANTSYHIRAYAIDEMDQWAYGAVMHYQVPAHSMLDVITYAATEITTIEAYLHAVIRKNNVTVKEKGFCWSTDIQNLDINRATRQKVDSEQFDLRIDVDYHTTYYYCAYAINDKDEVYYGKVEQFTAKDINLPTVSMAEATQITENAAMIKISASLDYPYREGHALRYGLLISSTNETPELDAEGVMLYEENTALEHNHNGNLVQKTTNFNLTLQPDTKYYYRAFASNAKGTSYSAEVKTFKTLKRTPSQGDVSYPDMTTTNNN